MKQWGGSSGLPFFAFLDSSGSMIVNSIEPPGDGRNGGDIGHPTEPHEIDWFMAMLRKAVPKMKPQELDVIERYLRAQKK